MCLARVRRKEEAHVTKGFGGGGKTSGELDILGVLWKPSITGKKKKEGSLS